MKCLNRLGQHPVTSGYIAAVVTILLVIQIVELLHGR